MINAFGAAEHKVVAVLVVVGVGGARGAAGRHHHLLVATHRPIPPRRRRGGHVAGDAQPVSQATHGADRVIRSIQVAEGAGDKCDRDQATPTLRTQHRHRRHPVLLHHRPVPPTGHEALPPAGQGRPDHFGQALSARQSTPHLRRLVARAQS